MNQVTVQLAIQALEAEKIRIDGAIAELRASMNGQKVVRSRSVAVLAGVATSPKPQARTGRRKLSAAGRAALALAAKRRWAKAKAAGKSTL